MNSKLIRNIVVALAILAIGIFVKGKLSAMSTKEEIREDRIKPRVKVIEVANDTIALPITVYGKLNATERVDLLAEVSGTFFDGDAPFLEGVAFRKGQIMLQLDNAEAQANVMGLKGSFINSVLAILPDLNADYPEAYAAWEAYYDALSLNSSLVPMPKTATKLEKFLIARGIPTAYYQVKSAEERLEKFCIRAPFDGVVAQASVKKGNLVSPGRALGSFVGSGGFELKGAVTLSYADELKLGQSITFTSPDRKGTWKGQIDRISPVVDDASQNINLIASLRGDDLKEGMYLTGTIANVEVYDALRVPAYMVFDNEYVYTVESDSLLAKTAVEVVEWLDESIVIKGLKNGQLLADAPTLKAASGTIVVAVKN